MWNWVAIGTVVLSGVLVVAPSAGAVNVNGVDYVLLAKRSILMDGSDAATPLDITGNVAVSDATGRLQIGAHNVLRGTATAYNVILGSFSSTTRCEFDVTAGTAPVPPVCGSVDTAALPLVAAWPPGPLGAVPIEACVTAAANVTVNGAVNLAPGCYRDVRVNARGTLNLRRGAYTFRSLRLLIGSTLNGASQTVNVQGSVITEASVAINDVTLRTPATGSDSVKIMNNSRLYHVTIWAPDTHVHLYTGTQAVNLSVVAADIVVQPMILTLEGCGCFESVERGAETVQLANAEHLDTALGFFLSTTCDITACPNGTTCFRAQPLPGGTATSVTLDIRNVSVPGVYRVVGQWPAGTFCNLADPVTIP